MTPAEALEQVRALHQINEDDGHLPRFCDECRGYAWPCDTIAILDAVTMDTPVTVETVEELEALPNGTAFRDAGGHLCEAVGQVNGIRHLFSVSGLLGFHRAESIALPATVLTPATPERTELVGVAAVERVL